MLCPRCATGKLLAIDTKPYKDGKEVRRRRRCRQCGYKVWTKEYPAIIIDGNGQAVFTEPEKVEK